MKLYKLLFIASAIVGGMMTSCSDDGYWDKAGASAYGLDKNGSIYTFNSDKTNYTFYPADNTENMDVTVTVNRSNTKGACTLPIIAEFVNEELLSGPASVTFEDGSATAEYVIHVAEDIEIGSSTKAYLTIDTTLVDIPYVAFPDSTLIKSETATHEDTLKFEQQEIDYSLYQNRLAEYQLENVVTIEKDYNWESLGTAMFSDAFLFDYNPYNAEIQRAVENPNWFRLVAPYAQGLDDEEYPTQEGAQDYVKFRLLQQGEVVRGTTVDKDDLVYYDDFKTGWYSTSYGAEVWALHPSRFTSMASTDFWIYNKVVEYQDDGTPAIVQLAPYYYMFGVGGWNYTKYDGVITIVFPGVEISDYSAEVVYAGLYTDVQDQQFVLADVTLGPDVDHAWVTVVPGKDNVQDAYSLLADGTITEYDPDADYDGTMKYLVVTEDGQYQIPMVPNSESGKYTIVIFTFDAEGNVIDAYQDFNYATFNYTGSGEAPETWEAAFVGDYVYNLIFTNEDGSPYNDEGLTLYQSSKDRYKIEHWGYDVDLIFTMAEDGELTIEEQETGATYGSYGPIYISTGNEYWGEDYDPESDVSYYANGVFHFNVVYHVAAGYLDGWYGEETFTLTGRAEAKSHIVAPWNTRKPVSVKSTDFKKPKTNKVSLNRFEEVQLTTDFASRYWK